MRPNTLRKSVGAALLLGAIGAAMLVLSHKPHVNQGRSATDQKESEPTTTEDRKTNDFAAPAQAASQRIKTAIESKNVAIRFWGKVTDQDGNALAGVKVTATTRIWLSSGSGFGSSNPTFMAVSGSDGRFEIDGGRGDLLTLKSIEKEGYEPEPMALRSYGYNISTNLTVSPDAPVVLRVWRKDQRQELIYTDKLFGIIPDGRTYTLDLINSSKIESAKAEGDLRLKISRPTDAKLGDRYTWSFEIEAIGGGLAEEPDRYAEMFVAPVNGYSNACRMTIEGTAARWSDMVPKNFYTKTRDGKYGRMKLEIDALYNLQTKNGAIEIKSALNPSGSRILR